MIHIWANSTYCIYALAFQSERVIVVKMCLFCMFTKSNTAHYQILRVQTKNRIIQQFICFKMIKTKRIWSKLSTFPENHAWTYDCYIHLLNYKRYNDCVFFYERLNVSYWLYVHCTTTGELCSTLVAKSCTSFVSFDQKISQTFVWFI